MRLPELAELLERLGAEGPDPLYRGDVAAAASEYFPAGRFVNRYSPLPLVRAEVFKFELSRCSGR